MKPLLIKKFLPYLVIFLGIAYGVWPLDIIPDVPLIGWFDDLGIIGLALYIAVKLFSNKKAKDRKVED